MYSTITSLLNIAASSVQHRKSKIAHRVIGYNIPARVRDKQLEFLEREESSRDGRNEKLALIDNSPGVPGRQRLAFYRRSGRAPSLRASLSPIEAMCLAWLPLLTAVKPTTKTDGISACSSPRPSSDLSVLLLILASPGLGGYGHGLESCRVR
ncbi:hypothetical protein BDZ89DRAFT_535208 [Hymenopellis radicata]|nr:hypothetical protein BDZ89DRAFT_535208 [Hymenopellis radicata]